MQRKEYMIFSLCILFLLIVNIDGCNGKSAEENTMVGSQYEKNAITLEEAIKKGKDEIKKAGYPYEELVAEADDNNTAWKEVINSAPQGSYDNDIKRFNLSKRKYWAIAYWSRSIPEKTQLSSETQLGNSGGWVFIDCYDGKVIGILLEE